MNGAGVATGGRKPAGWWSRVGGEVARDVTTSSLLEKEVVETWHFLDLIG